MRSSPRRQSEPRNPHRSRGVPECKFEYRKPCVRTPGISINGPAIVMFGQKRTLTIIIFNDTFEQNWLVKYTEYFVAQLKMICNEGAFLGAC